MPAPTIIARLGLNVRGFFAGLKESEIGAKEFGKMLPKVIGDAAVGAAVGSATSRFFDKIFRTKESRGQTRVLVEKITGIDPQDPGHFRAKLGVALGLIATAGAATAIAGAKMAGEIKDQAEQSDLTTDQVQKLGKAARSSGLDFSNFASGLDNMGGARREAIESSEELRKKFAKYGVTLQDLLNPQKSNLDLLKQMSRAVKDVDFSSLQRRDFRDMLGKGGEKLIASIKALESTPGSIIPEEAINSLDRGDKLLSRMVNEAKVLGATLGGGILGKIFKEAENPTNGVTRRIKSGAMAAGGFLGTARDWVLSKLGIDSQTDGGWRPWWAPTGRASADHPSVRSLGELLGPSLKPPQEDDKLARMRGAELIRERTGLEFQMMNPAEQIKELRRRIATTNSALQLSPESMASLGVGAKESLLNQRLQAQVQLKQMLMQYETPAVRDSLAAIGGGTANTAAITPLARLLDVIVKNTADTAENTKTKGTGSAGQRRYP